jgi:hypothetical protein
MRQLIRVVMLPATGRLELNPSAERSTMATAPLEHRGSRRRIKLVFWVLRVIKQKSARVKKDSVEERDSLKRRAGMSEKLARGLQDEVDNYRDEVRTMKKDLLEMEELERIRSDRTRSIEFEMKDAQAGLLEAT